MYAHQQFILVDTKNNNNNTPGPGQYEIDRKLATSAMAFHGYKVEAKKDTFPGPGKYDVKHDLGKDAPSFTIRSRIEQNKKPLAVPYQAIPSTIGDGPKPSLHGRYDLKNKESTPGPNYVPPSFGKETKASSLYSRREPKKSQDQVPGPGQYPIQSTVGAGKKYSMKARQFPPDERGVSASPGPAYLPNFQDQPKGITIHNRIPDPKDKEPAPKYVALPSTIGNDGPKFTIGRREELELSPGLP